ncbi:MAG: lytic transglycosylase domain-containing protein [Paracoccaceae bacterium]
MVRGWAFPALAVALLAACASTAPEPGHAGADRPRIGAKQSLELYPNETPELRALIVAAAARYDVPLTLVQRLVIRESRHRPGARNGPYYGLLQIHPSTARTMGYRGSDKGLLDAETNLEYGVKYLRGAWLVAEGDPDEAIGWYARGYYYEAKRKGLLRETGLKG